MHHGSMTSSLRAIVGRHMAASQANAVTSSSHLSPLLLLCSVTFPPPPSCPFLASVSLSLCRLMFAFVLVGGTADSRR